MRQINFIFIFVVGLALVLFSLQNTDLVTVNVVDTQVQIPLAIALILAAGVGAVFAWLLSMWMGIQYWFEAAQKRRKIRQQDKQIVSLEKDLEQYKVELLNQPSLPPASKAE